MTRLSKWPFCQWEGVKRCNIHTIPHKILNRINYNSITIIKKNPRPGNCGFKISLLFLSLAGPPMWSRDCSVTSPTSNHKPDPSPCFVPGPRHSNKSGNKCEIHPPSKYSDMFTTTFVQHPSSAVNKAHYIRVLRQAPASATPHACIVVHKWQQRMTLKRSLFIFNLRAQKKYSCSFITLRLNHWCHMDYFNNALPTFLGHKTFQLCCWLCRVRKLTDFIKNILICVLKMNEGFTGLEQHEVE